MLKDRFLKQAYFQCLKTDLSWSTYNIQKVAVYGALAPQSKNARVRGVSHVWPNNSSFSTFKSNEIFNVCITKTSGKLHDLLT